MDWTPKYDGRGFEFRAYVNTDEDAVTLTKRLQKALSGPGDNAVMILVSTLRPEETGRFLALAAEYEVAGAVEKARKA